ncbi:type I-G CRISPR-associated helicase/endonuclease Cas3g [Nocardiopsis baichengensis]|uniref:type I-G CRISPR-associated helicase/endonuclease Cas3g n=1 Tax=Nocardiopsis baichengensis TaxID=280240 RepID=UPI000346D28D|nr:type I-U CRISPR-associated helicase/endonuclease Cas3 [Nocardiopsis baichengensis]
MKLDASAFVDFYRAMHGYAPFPWQQDLAVRILDGQDWPAGIDVATGLGKTSIIDIAVFAAAARAPAARRRTFFIVDRRLVVDEAYDHALKIARALSRPQALECEPEHRKLVEHVADLLRPEPDGEPLEVERMRGGTTWSWRWVTRPDAHAVVVGTVDQIGSRILMRGYGLSPNLAPIDAALVGTDSLILCDEAHLSTALLQTLSSAASPGDRLAAPVVVPMSATITVARGARVHSTGEDDLAHPVAKERLRSPRRLHLIAPSAPKAKAPQAVVDQLSGWAHALGDASKEPGRVVLTVCNTVQRARAVHKALGKLGVEEQDRLLMIGRTRPIDRDHLIATAYPLMKLGRERTRIDVLHVVATQTVEVGANIDADALVSESASYSALVQRLGRLGRAPEIRDGTRLFPAVIVHDPATGDDDPVYGPARNATWSWLSSLTEANKPRKGRFDPADLGAGHAVSPVALDGLSSRLTEHERVAMEAPTSYIPHLWESTVDLWSHTSPRPAPDVPVAPYLHGIDTRPADVDIVWRADITADELPRPGQPVGEDLATRIAALPPTADEMLSVSSAAVKRWAAGTGKADVDDMDSARDDGQPHLGNRMEDSSTTDRTTALVYRGEGNVEAVDLRQVRPGETVIVPASYGGCDQYGWNPADRRPVTDVADLAIRRGRPLVRLGDRLADLADEEALPLVRALLNTRDEILEAKEEPETEDFADVLTSDVSTSLEPVPEGGPLTRSERLAANLRTLAENGLAKLVQTSTDPAQHKEWVLAGNGRPLGSDAGAAVSSAASGPVELDDHQKDVARQAAHFARNLGLPEPEVCAVWLAGRHHDEGKRDPRFQAMLYGLPPGATEGLPVRAKSDLDPSDARGFRLAARRSTYPRGMRHEALSVAIARHLIDHEGYDLDTDLVLHLIAAHHGRARPLVPAAADPAPVTVAVPGTDAVVRTDDLDDADQPARFHRLQHRYGKWKLALLETVVRMADIWCSAAGRVTTDPDPCIPRRAATTQSLKGHRAVENRVRLAALDGRDPLGFLAALGTLRLLTEEADIPARLSFDSAEATAHITSPLPDADAIAATLAALVQEMVDEQLLPGAPADWPPRQHEDGSAGDPLRVTRADYPGLVQAAGESGQRWLPVLTTDLALDAGGRCAITPFMAPAGRQTAATFFAFPLERVRAEPDLISQALTSWRRIDGYTGEYLDHRAIRTAADVPSGESTPAGVPGATWLATQALPFLHLSGNDRGVQAALWQRIGRRRIMRWPVWNGQLELHAARALIIHPVLNRVGFDSEGAGLLASAEALGPLGVITLGAAERIAGKNSSGALAPLEVGLY